MCIYRRLRDCEKKMELFRKNCNNDLGTGGGTCKKSIKKTSRMVSWPIRAHYQCTVSKLLKECKCRPMLTEKNVFQSDLG